MTTTDHAPTGADTVLDRHFDDLDAEFAATRRLLERFPAEHADFKPHEKSTSLAVLASHVATLPQFAALMLNSDEHDMAATPYKPEIGRTAAELVAMFDRSAAAARRPSPAPNTSAWATAGSCAWATRCSSTAAAARYCGSTS